MFMPACISPVLSISKITYSYSYAACKTFLSVFLFYTLLDFILLTLPA